jgi:hypothetical protein
MKDLTPALAAVDFALGRSDFDSVRDKLGQVSERMHDFANVDVSKRLFDKLTPNTLLRLKPHYKDVIATKHLVEADEATFSKFCRRLAVVMGKSPYYCLSWWYQGLLAIGISAAEARAATNRSVADYDIANLEDAVDAVDHAYTRLLVKLRQLKSSSNQSIWSKVKAGLRRALLYLRNSLNRIASGVHRDTKDPSGLTRLAVKSGVIALVTKLLQLTLGSFAAAVLQLMSIPAFNKVKVNQHDLLADKLVMFIGRAAEGVKLYTRPDFVKSFYGNGSAETDVRLYGVIKQIRREVEAAKQHADMNIAFESALRACSDRRLELIGRSDDAIRAAAMTAKAGGYYPYFSAGSSILYLFKGNGNDRVLGQKLYESFAREAAKVLDLKSKPEPKRG